MEKEETNSTRMPVLLELFIDSNNISYILQKKINKNYITGGVHLQLVQQHQTPIF